MLFRDRPEIIGSGSTTLVVTDPRHVGGPLRRHGVVPRQKVASAIERMGAVVEAPEAGAVRLVATPLVALRSGAAGAERGGLPPVILGGALEGETRDLGSVLGGRAPLCAVHGNPVSPPDLLLREGEVMVTLRGRGRREKHGIRPRPVRRYGRPRRTGGDDCLRDEGVDGVENDAEVMFGDDTRRRATDLALRPMAFLMDNGGHNLSGAANDLVIKGRIYTNVNDIRAISIQWREVEGAQAFLPKRTGRT